MPLKDVLTDNDDVQDLILWGIMASLVVGLVLTVYTVVWKNAPFSFMDFGTGVGLLLTGGGVGYVAKRKGDE